MRKCTRFAVAIGVVGVIAWLQPARAAVLEPSADTNVEEHTPDSDDTTQPRIQVRSRSNPDPAQGRQHYGYIQFDLSFIDDTINLATFTLSIQQSPAVAAGDNQVYGLNDVAGNTPQDWMTLTYNTTGNELGKDGDPTTQNLGTFGTTGTEQLWDIGDLPEIMSMPAGSTTDQFISIDGVSNPQLLAFLNSRRGGFATLMLVQDDMRDAELLFNSMEDEAHLRPMLDLPEFDDPTLPGDFNGDNSVDAADYVVWRKGPNPTQEDYDTWRANFGRPFGSGASVSASAGTVPEPASIGLLGLGLALLLHVRRGRH